MAWRSLLALSAAPNAWRTIAKTAKRWGQDNDLRRLEERHHTHWMVDGFVFFIWEDATAAEVGLLGSLCGMLEGGQNYRLCFSDRENETHFDKGMWYPEENTPDYFSLGTCGPEGMHYEHPIHCHGDVPDEDKHIDDLNAHPKCPHYWRRRD